MRYDDAEERLRTEGNDANTKNEDDIAALHLAAIGGIQWIIKN